MKTSTAALTALLAAATSSPFGEAFTPSSLLVRSTGTTSFVGPRTTSYGSYDDQLSLGIRLGRTEMSASAGFLGMDEDDEDTDDEDDDMEDDDDMELSTRSAYSSTSTSTTSPFTGMTLDPWDPNPIIKPRPSKFFSNEEEKEVIPDDQLVQTMSDEERKENLNVMRQIQKNDLPDLRMRKDHAGWVEANNDLKRRKKRDPWFALNDRLRDAIQLDQGQDKVDYLKNLISKLGGLPPGIPDHPRGYAVHTEIYDIGISPNRASAILEREIREERAARGRAMMQERKKNMEKEARQYEEDMRNPGLREDKEAKERRERTMRRLMGEIEEDNKKKRERAKELLGKLPETPESRTSSMDKAIDAAREEVKNIRRKQLGRGGSASGSSADNAITGSTSDEDKPKSGADKAREAAAAEASGGRPRLPGDRDVTLGELDPSTKVESSSSTVTGPLNVEVTSTYNKEQSDPPMRKHCFQYTIRITNNSPTDTIQLLGRRFEIQTVGSSMKDVVSGEGVTGRQPILKPGEVFEYTSTAPLSVRPIGTTIIAARMRGEYRYVTLTEGQDTATPEQVEAGGDASSELGTFHFIFPDEQRVQPFRPVEDDDDEDEDEDEDDVAPTAESTPAATPATPLKKTPSAQPASTLPGDEDMKTGDLRITPKDASDTVTDEVRVGVSSSYRPERSDSAQEKHCFAYNIRITNESSQSIQLVSRRFEIQTIGSVNKDVVQGPGVTGRQPILKPGESFEYTSTAPLSVRPMLEKTPVVARMQGEYNFVQLADDGSTPISSTPLQAKLGEFHFILPSMDVA
eukprot:CAMPEP_0195282588 /NCGR_PEP_ID=MMETSP0707-20130614/1387_1 /TAXON_ID=33640 /ORGANISM="Asterionellopsis glacialis, Strain CCMP134" /LENGTH=800 /DNA_ID=CAMNT_0040341571 /DNA_START=42 /DNA_END=2444 /DNA_ORIENTATION=+